jgi:ribosomal protein S18 acetylase RimI-like enzyme
MTILTPMSEAAFAVYLAKAIPEFAQDKVNAGQWAAEVALELSRSGYAEQLPQGLATPDNFFFTVRDAATRTDIGMLWFAVQERAGQQIAYVYDVYIHTEHQHKGHASRAFAALDGEARQRGLTGVALHVFGHNTGAQALYQKLGYLTTNINMFKTLGATALSCTKAF